ncbi:unnamed protein product [Ixodes pacificus]
MYLAQTHSIPTVQCAETIINCIIDAVRCKLFPLSLRWCFESTLCEEFPVQQANMPT